MGQLEHKIALVTGAARGIGRAIALALGREGARVFVNYRADKAQAKEVSCEIASALTRATRRRRCPRLGRSEQ